MKEYYKERFGIPDEKFLWITNGTDLELFKDLPVADENEKKTLSTSITPEHTAWQTAWTRSSTSCRLSLPNTPRFALPWSVTAP